MALFGAAIGSLIGGSISDKYGRKPTIIISDILFMIGAVVMAFAPDVLVLMSGRFIVGLGVGIAAMVIPVYLAECSPKEIRGRIVTLNIISITVGQFISVCILSLIHI